MIEILKILTIGVIAFFILLAIASTAALTVGATAVFIVGMFLIFGKE